MVMAQFITESTREKASYSRMEKHPAANLRSRDRRT